MRLFRFKKNIVQTDDEIIAAFKATGQQEYIGLLFEKYSHLVYGVCYNYLKDEEQSKDAVMFIFEKLFVDLKKYEVTNFGSWIHSVSRNYCFAQMKQNGKTVLLDDKNNTDFVVDSQQDNSDDYISLHIDKLGDALRKINEEQQICIRMFYLENKSYNEIEATTGYNYKQVKSFIQNGKRNLKIYLTETNSEKKSK